jgi:hypothetical protein
MGGYAMLVCFEHVHACMLRVIDCYYYIGMYTLKDRSYCRWIEFTVRTLMRLNVGSSRYVQHK